MTKLPKIYVGADKNTVVTRTHDHSRESYGSYGMVSCEDSNCRRELIDRLGGVEVIWRTWYCALGEEISFFIPQAGMKNADGSTFTHKHVPHGAEWSIACDSPDCTAFFEDEWRRFQILRRAGNPGRAVASPTSADRPKSIARMDKESADAAEYAKRAADIEMEVKRRLIEQAYPLPR